MRTRPLLCTYVLQAWGQILYEKYLNTNIYSENTKYKYIYQGRCTNTSLISYFITKVTQVPQLSQQSSSSLIVTQSDKTSLIAIKILS